MFPPDLIARAAELIARYRAAGLMAATAESCTGGLIAGLLTEIPGSSDMLERGFVVYSNAAKQELLGVPAETLARPRRGERRDGGGDGGGRARRLARRGRGQRHRNRRAGRRHGGKAGRPRPFRLRAARRSRRSRAKSGSATSAARRCGSPRSGSASICSRRRCASLLTPVPSNEVHQREWNERVSEVRSLGRWAAILEMKPMNALGQDPVCSPSRLRLRRFGARRDGLRRLAERSERTPDAQAPAHMSQKLHDDLTKAGFTDITIMPSSFLVRAKDSQGNPVMMVINPDSLTEVTEHTQRPSSTRSAARRRDQGRDRTARFPRPPPKP